MIIYKSTNKNNGKCYIGQTIKTLEQRKLEHQRVKLKYYFQDALHKCGFDSFKWEILCECNSTQDMDLREKFYIKKFDSFNNGYNLTIGGNSHCRDGGTKGSRISKSKMGHKVNDDTKKKISETLKDKGYIQGQFLKGNNYRPKETTDETKKKLSISLKKYFKNNPTTQERIRKCKETSLKNGTYEKVSKRMSGRKVSEETKKKISESTKGVKKKYPKNRKGHDVSIETRLKISNALKLSHKRKGHKNTIG